MPGEKKKPFHGLRHDLLSINRKPASFHGSGKVEGNMDRFVFAGIAGQDSNECTGEVAFQVFLDNSLRVIEKSDDLIGFLYRQADARVRDIHEKGMPAWAFEIQTL